VKQWLSTFSAVLLALLIAATTMFVWVRQITRWDSFADELAKSLRASTSKVQYAEEPSLYDARLLKLASTTAQSHLSRQPWLASDRALQDAYAGALATITSYQEKHPEQSLDLLGR
jgi:tripartite-type tricarboxylate transporter receptor subunit TctC